MATNSDKVMTSQISILLLEDNAGDADLLRARLEAEGFQAEITQVDGKEAFEGALQKFTPDLIISDCSIPGYDGRSALKTAQQSRPETPFIFFSGTIGEESAIETLKLGASDYVLKDKPKRLTSAIQRALDDQDQRQRQNEAAEQIAAQAQLLDLATDAIIVRDLEDRVQFWNQSAERLLGFSKNEMVGRKSTEFMSSGLLKAYLEAKEATLRVGHWEGELENISKENPILVMSRWTLVRNKRGQPDRILVINTDIREKKSLERQFLRAQRLESVGTLASGIAHDLNNILAPILMASEVLRDVQATQGDKEMMDMVKTSAERGAGIVKQLLTFVRGGSGKLAIIRVDRVIKDVFALVKETFPKNITAQCEIQPDLLQVNADPTQIHQVLMNLCVNARDAMPTGGSLTIKVMNTPESYVKIEVKDSGSGIPSDVLENIFDPFFTTKEPGKGTGLGLSTVMGIVKSHGGQVVVESAFGVGTTFSFLLSGVAPSDESSEGNASAQPPRGRGELVLVVDDEINIRTMIRQTLATNGYEVLMAHDGAAGVNQFTRHRNNIKLIITDIEVPGLDGAGFSNKVRELKAGIKILATTGATDDRPFPSADRLLRKPFLPNDLLRAASELLHRESAQDLRTGEQRQFTVGVREKAMMI
jgi:PAS domain S-box-containing protein